MEDLNIEGTEKTPLVTCIAHKNFMRISGVCIPEDAVGYFQPIMDWLTNYLKQGAKLKLELSLHYYNTASSHMITRIFSKIDDLISDHSLVEVFWFYEEDDIDMEDMGQDYKDVFPNLAITTLQED